MSLGELQKYVLLWCIGFYLRVGLLVVPPLIPRLESEIGFNSGQSALATSLPLLLLGIGALAGGWLIGRLGVLGTLLTGLAVMMLASATRSLSFDPGFFLLVTLLMGVGIALMQTALPALTRAWLPDNLGRAAAVYTFGLLFGEWLAAGYTGPISNLLPDPHWHLVFVAWMLPVPLLILAILTLSEREALQRMESERPVSPMMPPWGDPLLWRIALVMASSGVLYFAGNIFLPPILAETGRIHLLDASLRALNGVQILAACVLIPVADRLLGKQQPFYFLITASLLTIPAMLFAPGAWILVAAGVLGALSSAILILALALPAWAVPSHEVSRFSSGMLCIGYTLVFLLPASGGWLTDATDLRSLSFLPIVIASLCALLALPGITQRVS